MKKFSLWFMATLLTLCSLAQEKADVDINIGEDKTSFWGSPWVWIVGAAVFILLLVALLRGGNRENA
jgi:hypothetical protein